MDKEQRSVASNFQKSVQTSTISVRAVPPSNGDALTRMSFIQENPVPIVTLCQPFTICLLKDILNIFLRLT